MIYRQETYIDDKNRTVLARTEVHDSLLTIGKVDFTAMVNGQIMTPSGPQDIPLQVPIDAGTIQEAFNNFDDQVPDRAKKIMGDLVESLKQEHRRALIAQGARNHLPRG